MRGYPAGEVKAYVEDNVTLPINRVTKCCQTCGFMSLLAGNEEMVLKSE